MIPYDGSDASNRAVNFVIDQPAGQRPHRIHVLNVQTWPIAYGEYLSPGIDIRELREAQLAQGRATLERVEHVLSGSGISFESHIVFGTIDEVIVDQTEQLGCDQIVMGTRGSGAFKGLFLGSVATKVVHRAQVPVTLVK
ncbi:nucleotide-binding universal stress UspA family protein [Panacagrimonas perspica]|uniref:Nucleotide-binding universal stress UspA family protein n=2 Tax=Panacagrimonas perspica TaxID=381431 RepID=A0A4R7PC31_9GAMM|nr:nucleotide-binding universal stress UspA family protein [Panacagrimonas perspica]